jgi:hypothetical protein
MDEQASSRLVAVAEASCRQVFGVYPELLVGLADDEDSGFDQDEIVEYIALTLSSEADADNATQVANVSDTFTGFFPAFAAMNPERQTQIVQCVLHEMSASIGQEQHVLDSELSWQKPMAPLSRVLAFLGGVMLTRVMAVCKVWKDAACLDALWEPLVVVMRLEAKCQPRKQVQASLKARRLKTNKSSELKSLCYSIYSTTAPPTKYVSKFSGVAYNRHKKAWLVSIKYQGRTVHLGDNFKCEIEAANAYDEAAKRYYGKKAQLNLTVKQQLQMQQQFEDESSQLAAKAQAPVQKKPTKRSQQSKTAESRLRTICDGKYTCRQTRADRTDER